MFYISRRNSVGYESAWCSDGDFHGMNYCYFPGEFRMNRLPVVKTWKTRAGIDRWLADRPSMKAATAVAEA